MPDGNRRRRHSDNQAKRRWYAQHRARRFRKRFGAGGYTDSRQQQKVPPGTLVWSFDVPLCEPLRGPFGTLV
jgi:hypothetical protein